MPIEKIILFTSLTVLAMIGINWLVEFFEEV